MATKLILVLVFPVLLALGLRCLSWYQRSKQRAARKREFEGASIRGLDRFMFDLFHEVDLFGCVRVDARDEGKLGLLARCEQEGLFQLVKYTGRGEAIYKLTAAGKTVCRKFGFRVQGGWLVGNFCV